MPNYTSIGRTKKLYGTQGAVRLQIKDSYFEALLQTPFIFIEIEKQGKKDKR